MLYVSATCSLVCTTREFCRCDMSLRRVPCVPAPCGKFTLSIPHPPSLRFVTRQRPIFARVLDGAGDRELRVFRGVSEIKTPSNRLQTG